MTARAIDTLFQPIELGALRLPNRIVMAPMSRYRAPRGIPAAQAVTYYARRAAGGVGLILSEGTFIDHPAAPGYENVPNFFGAEAFSGWRAVLDAVHTRGARMMPQLWHVGGTRRLGMAPDPGVPGIGPCTVEEEGREVVRAMTDRDAADIAASYARSALSARDLGFDGVAIHGAHGYLLDQFFWSRTNRRTDRYAGSVEARTRLATEVVGAMRAAVGPRFPIVFRYSQWKMDDYEARIAETPAELERLLGRLVDAGVDVFDVSTRRFWVPAFDGDPRSLAAWTRHLSGRPVIAVGSVGLDQPHQSKVYRTATNTSARFADLTPVVEAMKRGDFDLVAVGRAILAEPEWPAKVRGGRYDEITPYTIDVLKSYE
jgi:2,4-dienoyl-CoA reductase-like NADH-dependent reductase (Old Yellow Enzyme family)